MSIAKGVAGHLLRVAGTDLDDAAKESPAERIARAEREVDEAEAAEPTDDLVLARALLARGRSYAHVKETDRALADFDRIVASYSRRRSVALRIVVGQALRGRAARLHVDRPEEAEQAGRRSVQCLRALAKQSAEAAEPLAESLRILAIILNRRGAHEQAIAVTDEVEQLVEVHSASEHLRLTHARTLSLRALALSRLGQAAEGIAVRERLVALYGSEPDKDIAHQVTVSELVLAEWVDQQGDRADAHDRLRQLVNRYSDVAAAQWPKAAEAALAQLGSFLWRDDRDAEALPHFDRWLDLFAGASDSGRRSRELRVRYRRARALGELGREPEALQALDELLADAQEGGEAEAEWAVTGAVVARVGLLHRLQGVHAALQALQEAHARLAERPAPDSPGVYVDLLYAELPLWREVNRLRTLRDAARAYIERFRDSHDLMAERGLAYAWQFRARVAWDLGDSEGETTALETVVARLGQSSDEAVLDRVDQARARLVSTLAQAGRDDALVAQVAATVKRFEAAKTDEQLVERGRRAIRGLGALTEAHRLEEVRPLAERVFAKAEPAGDLAGDIAIRALHVVAACQQQAGEQEAFEQTYDRLFEFGEHSVAMYRELSQAFATMDTESGRYQHAFHLFGLAKALEAVHRDQECLDVIDEAFRFYADNQEDGMPEMMALALEDRDELRARLAGGARR